MSAPYGAESGAGKVKEEAAFYGGEGIILCLTEKFGVVREGEMPRRESGPTQLDERSVSVIRLLLPPTSESFFIGRDGILHHPEKKADGNEYRGEQHRQRSGDRCGSRFPISAVKIPS